mmetsp:Transcript_21478/g.39301  ORF Transcript_21478/g.39301 Transcript_21478/m.39301 type:complete len:393 (+) Transcript_21478:38-1216(+)
MANKVMAEGISADVTLRIQRTMAFLFTVDKLSIPEIATICESSIEDTTEVLMKHSKLTSSGVLSLHAKRVEVKLVSHSKDDKDSDLNQDQGYGMLDEEVTVGDKEKGQHTVADEQTSEVVVDFGEFTFDEEITEEPEECVQLLNNDVKRNRNHFTPDEKLFGKKVETPVGIYLGQVKGDDSIDGYGRYYYYDGSYAEGYWSKGLLSGKGKFFSHKGFYYIGNWLNGLKNGTGKFISGEMTYEGDYVRDVREGRGVETWSTGLVYHGQYRRNAKDGQGVLKLSNDDTYEGSFKGNQLEGSGTYKWVSGNTYVGTWHRSEMHGNGIYTWADGQVYEGQFINGLKEGKGKLTYPDGKVVEGTWRKDKQHGEGTLFVQGEEPRRGFWIEGVEAIQE